MRILDLFESVESHKTVVIIPGGFHPFHAGHKSLFDYAKKTYPYADIYFAASDSTKTRPFTFEQKVELAKLFNIDRSRFVKVISPFKPQEITSNYNPNKTVVVFIRSEKDRDSTPDVNNNGFLKPMVKNPDVVKRVSYVDYAPVIEFDIDGEKFDSASDIRSAYSMADENERISILTSVYPVLKTDANRLGKIKTIFDTALENVIAEQVDLEDPRSREAFKIARTRYPMAKSREEALFLYSMDRASNEIDNVEQVNIEQDTDINRIDRVNDKQERVINRIANLEKELADQVFDLQSKINSLDRNKKEKVSENAKRNGAVRRKGNSV